MSSIRIHEEVRSALRERRPVVALETAVVTHGLPRCALGGAAPAGVHGWCADAPVNLEAARAMSRAVRDGGAIPATIAVLDGAVHIGLDETALIRLANDESAAKASVTTLASALAQGTSAGTTVSATLAALRLADADGGGVIRVLATGGIGGVHRGWAMRPDLSADLALLASTPVCVVCGGPKSILDVPATAAALEGLGVPVIGYRTGIMPRFIVAGDASIPVPVRVDDVRTAAEVCRNHWLLLRRASSVLLALPAPDDLALEADEVERCLRGVERESDDVGPARTPRLLDALARATDGRSVRVNIAVLVGNAKLASDLACVLSDGGR